MITKNKEDYYYIPNIGWLPRVTKILDIISKGEAFNNWLINKGQQAKVILSDAGDIGSSLHNRLEEIGKGIVINKDALKERERLWVEEFEKWQAENIQKFIETEHEVFNVKERYAGTLDALVKLRDGRIALLDYKTARYIYDTYELQVCAYIKAYEEMKNTKIDTAFILRFDKEKKENYFEIKEVKDIEGQYGIFLCALKLWYWKEAKYDRALCQEKEKNGT